MQTFILLCTNFVLLMTIPGLALFYGGLSQAPNVLATVMHSFSIMCIVTLLWMFVGYTISFDQGPSSNAVVGGPDLAWLKTSSSPIDQAPYSTEACAWSPRRVALKRPSPMLDGCGLGCLPSTATRPRAR